MGKTIPYKPPDPLFDEAPLEVMEADNYEPKAPLRFVDIVAEADKGALVASIGLEFDESKHPRVPAGSGRASGEFGKGDSVVTRTVGKVYNDLTPEEKRAANEASKAYVAKMQADRAAAKAAGGGHPLTSTRPAPVGHDAPSKSEPSPGGGTHAVGPLVPTPSYAGLPRDGLLSASPAGRAVSAKFVDDTVKALAARADTPEQRYFAGRLQESWGRIQARQGDGGDHLAALPGDRIEGLANISINDDERVFRQDMNDAMVAAYIPEPVGYTPTVTSEEAARIEGGIGDLYHTSNAGTAIERDGFKLPEQTSNLNTDGRGVYFARSPGGYEQFGGETLRLVTGVRPDQMDSVLRGRMPSVRASRGLDGFSWGRAMGDVTRDYNSAAMIGENIGSIERGARGMMTEATGVMYHPHDLSVVRDG